MAAALPAGTLPRRAGPLIRSEDGVGFPLQATTPPCGEPGQPQRPLKRGRVTACSLPALMGGGELVRQLLERVAARQEKVDPDLRSLFSVSLHAVPPGSDSDHRRGSADGPLDADLIVLGRQRSPASGPSGGSASQRFPEGARRWWRQLRQHLVVVTSARGWAQMRRPERAGPDQEITLTRE